MHHPRIQACLGSAFSSHSISVLFLGRWRVLSFVAMPDKLDFECQSHDSFKANLLLNVYTNKPTFVLAGYMHLLSLICIIISLF